MKRVLVACLLALVVIGVMVMPVSAGGNSIIVPWTNLDWNNDGFIDAQYCVGSWAHYGSKYITVIYTTYGLSQPEGTYLEKFDKRTGEKIFDDFPTLNPSAYSYSYIP